MKTLRMLLPLIAAAAISSHAGSKAPGVQITFHPEGEESDGPRMVMPDITQDGQRHYFRISPEISIKHLHAYYAFPAQDGVSWGVALRLNEEGRRAHQILTTTYGGKLVRTVVNGRAVDTLRVDQAPDDGWIMIWRGLTPEDLKLMDTKLKKLESRGG